MLLQSNFAPGYLCIATPVLNQAYKMATHSVFAFLSVHFSVPCWINRAQTRTVGKLMLFSPRVVALVVCRRFKFAGKLRPV